MLFWGITKTYKLSSKPNFERSTIFDENLIACHMKKTEVYFNKPIYVGQEILDLSKTLMFDFHYNYIRKKFGDRAELLFTDTDSLMYLIRTEDFYQDIIKDIKRKFDTSDYPEQESIKKSLVSSKMKWVENKLHILLVFAQSFIVSRLKTIQKHVKQKA